MNCSVFLSPNIQKISVKRDALAVLLRSFLDVKKRAVFFLFGNFFFVPKEKVTQGCKREAVAQAYRS